MGTFYWNFAAMLIPIVHSNVHSYCLIYSSFGEVYWSVFSRWRHKVSHLHFFKTKIWCRVISWQRKLRNRSWTEKQISLFFFVLCVILCFKEMVQSLNREPFLNSDKKLNWKIEGWSNLKGPFTQAIFAAIFLLLMHAIKWIDLRMY